MGVKKDNITANDKRLIETLKAHPELYKRVESILELANESDDGPLRSADEIESLLVQELRKLGNETLTSWGNAAEQKCAKQYREQNPGADQWGKKN